MTRPLSRPAQRTLEEIRASRRPFDNLAVRELADVGLLPRWCRDCGHESHAPGRCPHRLSMSRVVQQIARGQIIRGQMPTCDCETQLRELAPAVAR